MRPDALHRAREARRRLAAPPPRPLRVADVTLFYGERSGGIRTYIDAKARWARSAPEVDHHVIVPGERERHERGWHELPSLRMAAANGYRLPIGVGALKGALRAIRPDVVLLHDPFWNVLGVVDDVHALGARVVAVHHGSSGLDAAGLPGPDAVWQPLLRAWIRRSTARVDALMAACDTRSDAQRAPDLRLRFGVHPAFRPRPEVPRGDHVLYVGRLAREKGVVELLEAAARADERWPIRFVGSGPLEPRLVRRSRRRDLLGRVRFAPYVRNPEALAREYAAARCVVMPGRHETFGLVALEAAASGAPVVVSESAPSAASIGDLGERFGRGAELFPPAGAPRWADLAGAIERARARERDLAAAARLAARASWPAAFAAELADLRALTNGPATREMVA